MLSVLENYHCEVVADKVHVERQDELSNGVSVPNIGKCDFSEVQSVACPHVCCIIYRIRFYSVLCIILRQMADESQDSRM